VWYKLWKNQIYLEHFPRSSWFRAIANSLDTTRPGCWEFGYGRTALCWWTSLTCATLICVPGSSRIVRLRSWLKRAQTRGVCGHASEFIVGARRLAAGVWDVEEIDRFSTILFLLECRDEAALPQSFPLGLRRKKAQVLSLSIPTWHIVLLTARGVQCSSENTRL